MVLIFKKEFKRVKEKPKNESRKASRKERVDKEAES